MKNVLFNQRFFLLFLFLFLLISPQSCKKEKDQEKPPSDTWDVDNNPLPKFVTSNYIELGKIYRISKYRSSVGHDYSDFTEQCRSMKHYFEPKGDVDWSGVKIFCPVSGSITRAEQEWAGIKYEIVSSEYPAFRFQVFHVNPSVQRIPGDEITAGDLLGTHTGMETMSDISVIVNDPTRQGRMVSYFGIISDQVFDEFRQRGVDSREDMIIPKSVRDANPISCSGDAFVSLDTLENWVVLQ